MAEELQYLIERIQKEAVDSAEQQAARLMAQSKEKAAAVVREAEEKAEAILRKAEQDAQVFTERSMRTLDQAARDLLITVGQGVENIVADLVAEATGEALKPQVLEQMLVKIAEAYAAKGGAESRIEMLVSPADQQELVKFFAERYRQKLVHGIELHADSHIVKGFKVSCVDGHAFHDFTREAIAESLAHFLRPKLAEIVHRAAGSSKEKPA